MPLDLTPSSARIKIASVYIHHAWDVSCGLFLPLSLWFVLLSMGSFLLSSHFSFSFNLSVYHPCLSLSWFSFLFPLSLWCHTLWSHARVCVLFFFFCLPVLDFFIHLYFKVSPPKKDFSLTFFNLFFFFSLWPCFAFPSVPDRGTEAEGQLLPSALWWLPSLTSYVSLHLILGGGKQASCLTAWVVNALRRTQCTHASTTGSWTSTNSC